MNEAVQFRSELKLYTTLLINAVFVKTQNIKCCSVNRLRNLYPSKYRCFWDLINRILYEGGRCYQKGLRVSKQKDFLIFGISF